MHAALASAIEFAALTLSAAVKLVANPSRRTLKIGALQAQRPSMQQDSRNVPDRWMRCQNRLPRWATEHTLVAQSALSGYASSRRNGNQLPCNMWLRYPKEEKYDASTTTEPPFAVRLLRPMGGIGAL